MLFTILGFIVLFTIGIYLLAFPTYALFYAKVLFPKRFGNLGRPEIPVNVIVPCKWDSEHLEENLRAVASQEYPRFTASFVTDTKDDGAVPAILRVVKDYPHAKHLVAGFGEKCAQKNHVQLTVMTSDTKNDVFVVCDSDLRPSPTWLEEMVRPYIDPGVCVTAASRWIQPSTRGLGACIYTGMGAYYPIIISCPMTPLLWGGCFSISRNGFHEMGIAERWNNTEDDDLVLAARLKELGRRPVFVPPAVSTSHESHATVRSLVKWFTRQGLTGKLHSFWYWVLLLFIESLTCLSMAGSVALLAGRALSGGIGAYVFFAPAAVAMVMINGLLGKLPYMNKKDMPLIWWMISPIPGHFAICYALWKSAFLKKMKWGSVTLEFNKDGTIRTIERHVNPGA
jgi:ceramide glucosyltransferase